MNGNAEDLTAPILDRAQVAELRRAGADRRRAEPEPAVTESPGGHTAGAWLALVVLGNLVVVAMLVLVVLWH